MGFKNKENDQRRMSQGLLVSSQQAHGLHPAVLRKLSDVLARPLCNKKGLEVWGTSLTIGRKQMMHLSSSQKDHAGNPQVLLWSWENHRVGPHF